MPQSHIPDYGSRLRSDSATTRKVKKSDYYPQWSGMSYHCLNAVVYVRNRVLRIGNGPERSAKHSRQLGASRNIRETQPILCSRITIVTMSWQILLYRIKIVTMSCVVWTVSGRCPVERAWSGEIFHCRFLPIESRLRPDLAECEPSLPNPFRNSPVINTKFGNNTHVRVPTITEHDTTESRQSRLQCGTAECDRIAFRQCPDHPEYGVSCRIPDAWISRFGWAAHVWSITCVCHSLTVLWPVHHECCS